MRLHEGIILGLLLMSLRSFAAAQTTPPSAADESRSTPAPALTGVMGIGTPVAEEDSSAGMPQIPALLGGPRLSLELGSEAERSNYLRAGVNVGATYDANAHSTPHEPP